MDAMTSEPVTVNRVSIMGSEPVDPLRLLSFVERRSADLCWPWSGPGLNARSGYVNYGGTGAHRLVYALLRNEFPRALTIDHLCRNRSCMNPSHMEPVPQGVNTLRGDCWSGVNARKTHCTAGHEFTEANTRRERRGRRRVCRACAAHRQRMRRAAKVSA
jgi:HNH endonuclease